jgi:hypothetical protein
LLSGLSACVYLKEVLDLFGSVIFRQQQNRSEKFIQVDYFGLSLGFLEGDQVSTEEVKPLGGVLLRKVFFGESAPESFQGTRSSEHAILRVLSQVL